jgi:hypothetical protein
VVTGRVTDTGLTLGPLVHEFGWPRDGWDLMAAGTVAGHIIECGAQCSGGNLLRDWKRVRGLENPGFPIVEVAADGSFVVTKHPGTGGVVSVASVTEQLVYEMGDPRTYITPDGTADFTTIRLRQRGRDRVHVSGIRGGPRTPMLKVSIAYAYGWKAVGTLVYAWPDAWEKACRADRILRARLAQLGLSVSSSSTSSPSTSVPTRLTVASRVRPIQRHRKCSSGSGYAPATAPPWSGSPGRSPRWSSPAHRA